MPFTLDGDNFTGEPKPPKKPRKKREPKVDVTKNLAAGEFGGTLCDMLEMVSPFLTKGVPVPFTKQERDGITKALDKFETPLAQKIMMLSSTVGGVLGASSWAIRVAATRASVASSTPNTTNDSQQPSVQPVAETKPIWAQGPTTNPSEDKNAIVGNNLPMGSDTAGF